MTFTIPMTYVFIRGNVRPPRMMEDGPVIKTKGDRSVTLGSLRGLLVGQLCSALGLRAFGGLAVLLLRVASFLVHAVSSVRLKLIVIA